MAYKITNLSKQLTILRLNSGKSVHLAPGKHSDAIEDYEVNSNAMLQKLSDKGVIALQRI